MLPWASDKQKPWLSVQLRLIDHLEISCACIEHNHGAVHNGSPLLYHCQNPGGDISADSGGVATATAETDVYPREVCLSALDGEKNLSTKPCLGY